MLQLNKVTGHWTSGSPGLWVHVNHILDHICKVLQDLSYIWAHCASNACTYVSPDCIVVPMVGPLHSGFNSVFCSSLPDCRPYSFFVPWCSPSSPANTHHLLKVGMDSYLKVGALRISYDNFTSSETLDKWFSSSKNGDDENNGFPVS